MDKMTRRTLLKCSSIFLTLSTLGLPARAESPALGDCDRLLIIGDSLAYGIKYLLKREAEDQGVFCRAVAIGGTRAEQWAKKQWLDEALKKYSPSVALVILGTNDAMAPQWRKEFQKHATKIVDKLHDDAVECVWSTPPNIKVPKDFIFEGAIKAGSDYVLDFRDLRVQLQPDLIHPTIVGNKTWVSAIWSKLQ